MQSQAYLHGDGFETALAESIGTADISGELRIRRDWERRLSFPPIKFGDSLNLSSFINLAIEILMSLVRSLSLVLAVFGVVVGSGCGRGDLPPLGAVNGTVTLDGAPLKGVIINFKPDVGRMATAVTDEQGKYVLEYTFGNSGSKVGPSTVMFEWPLGESGPAIPKKYVGLESALKVDVTDGSNSFDFDLVSQ